MRTRFDRLRWPSCLLVVLGVHAVAMLRLREITPAAVAVDAPPAVSIDLAPLPAPPTLLPAPPALAATETPPPPPILSPPQPIPPQRTPPEPVPPEPVPPEPVPPEPVPPEPVPPEPAAPEPAAALPDPLPPEPVAPEVALPRPVSPKRPPPARHRLVVKTPPAATPPVATSPIAAPAVRPVQEGAPQTAPAPGAASASWESAVAAYLARFKRYPVTAQRRGQQGVALVRFSVDRTGMVQGIALVRSSGHADLDTEAKSLVDRAQPLPRPPADMSGTTIELVVPVRFSLH